MSRPSGSFLAQAILAGVLIGAGLAAILAGMLMPG